METSLGQGRARPSRRREGLPIPGLEGIAGALEEVAFQDNAAGRIYVILQLWVIAREVLVETQHLFQQRLGQKQSTAWPPAAFQAPA